VSESIFPVGLVATEFDLLEWSLVSKWLLIFGSGVLSMSLRTAPFAIIRKLGVFGVIGTSFLIGWLLSGSLGAGFFCASTWLLLPWLEILTRVRKLVLPVDKTLYHKTPPNADAFPSLEEFTEEIEGEGFEYMDDLGWEGPDSKQFYRLNYHAADRAQATICFIEQQNIAFYFLGVTSRSVDGKVWTTWNYPFGDSLRQSPDLRINRLRGELTFFALYESHRDFLHQNRVATAGLEVLDSEAMQKAIEGDLRDQVNFNLTTGILRKNLAGEVRYSWRGLFFLWVQFLREFVRIF